MVRWLVLALLSVALVVSFAMTLGRSDRGVEIVGLPKVVVKGEVLVTGPSVLVPPPPGAVGWMPLQQPLSSGFGERVQWVRLTMDVPPAQLNHPMVVRFQPSNIRDVRFYLPGGEVWVSGTQVPFDQRAVPFPDIAAAFTPTQSPVVVDMRFATAGRLFGSLQLLSESAYHKSQITLVAAHGIFYGMLLLALMVNLLNWARSRSALYGTYASFVFFALLGSLTLNGYLHAYLPARILVFHGVIQLFAFIGMVSTAVLFALRVLEVHASNPNVARLVAGFALALLLLLPLAFVMKARPYIWELVFAAYTVYGLGALAASVRHLHRLPSLSRSLLALSYLVFSLSLAVTIAAVFGSLSGSPLNVGMWQIGLGVHLLLLQMVLTIQERQAHLASWQRQADLQALLERAEADSRRSQQLRGTFERLAHEFKTPLAVIDSSVQSLELLEQGDDPERSTRYARIRRSVSRLNEILMQSLADLEVAASQPTRGEGQVFLLSGLLDAVIGEASSTAGGCIGGSVFLLDHDEPNTPRQLRLVWIDTADPGILRLKADAESLHAALLQLLRGACRYGDPGHDIVLTIARGRSGAGQPLVILTLTGIGESLMSGLAASVQTDPSVRFSSEFAVASETLRKQNGDFKASVESPGRFRLVVRLPLHVDEAV